MNAPDRPSGQGTSRGPGPPSVVGPYHIVEKIGEGGMGMVYSAEQTHPVRRRVALKMMRAGADSADVVARFEAERHALAVMDHPGIARVLDAGVSDDGRPYFVMELVRGVRIDQYCDRFRLTARERIELFVALCEAVQHAHQKGVIHRDLKPSNVLVTEQDGRPVPKVIDFGIAKAVVHPLSDAPFATSGGQAVGTLAYMSPEQAESSELDVDTRADVYSLGIILYELLAGAVPVDPSEAGVPRFLAQLVSRDTPPPLPRDRIDRGGDTAARVAKARGTDPESLRRSLGGDIQWIVLRAIEKDRSRRYETANGLRLDLVRYLNDEPVLARPPSTAYRMGKFARRNRAAVALGGVAALGLLLGTAATAVGLLRARRAESAAIAARAEAQLEARSAEQVVDFLVDLFEVSDPGAARGSTVTARELLDRGARRVEEELADQPVVRARMLSAIGEVYRKLGLLDESVVLLARALSLVERHAPEDGARLAAALQELGTSQRERGDLGEAERNLARALALWEEVAGAESHEVSHARSSLASTYLEQGRLDDAEPLLEVALAFEEADAGRDHVQLGTLVNDLGALALYRGEFVRAEQYLSRAATIRERQGGADHPERASTLMNLGVAYYYQERFEEALEAYQRARSVYEATLDAVHPNQAMVRNNIAEVYWKLGRNAEAERLFIEALALKERTLTPDNTSIATTLTGLANVYRDQGRYAEAGPRYRRAIQIYEEVVGPTHRRLLEPLRDYALMLRTSGEASAAANVEARIARIESSD